jgi:hypothetical protein
MSKYGFLMAIVMMLANSALAASCATDDLRALVGKFTGAASMVTVDNGEFHMRRPKTLAPTTILNRSVFSLDRENPCEQFKITIDYLKPKLVGELSGQPIAREVTFNGVAENDGTFTLYAGDVKKGQLRKIDDETFFAMFEAPNPLKPTEQTRCKEFISLSRSKTQVVRTLQCFDLEMENLIQYRLVKEQLR